MTQFETALKENELLEFAYGKGIYFDLDREYGEHSVYQSWSKEILPLIESKGKEYLEKGIKTMFQEIVDSDSTQYDNKGNILLYHLHVLYYLINEGKFPRIDLSPLEVSFVPILEQYLENVATNKKAIISSIKTIQERGGLQSDQFRLLIYEEHNSNTTSEEITELASIEFSEQFDSNPSYIKDFEEKYLINIPPDYKTFLLENGGGVPVQNNYYKELDTGGIYDFEISAFYGNSGDTSLDLGFYYMMTLGVIPRGLMPFADDGIGNHICIGHSGEYLNKIYIVWDTETEQLEDVVKLEDSLGDFIKYLR